MPIKYFIDIWKYYISRFRYYAKSYSCNNFYWWRKKWGDW